MVSDNYYTTTTSSIGSSTIPYTSRKFVVEWNGQNLGEVEEVTMELSSDGLYSVVNTIKIKSNKQITDEQWRDIL